MGGILFNVRPLTRRIALCSAFALTSLPIALALTPTALANRAVATNLEPKVDAVFDRWTASTPGCAVGVATDGTPALAKGYGMADLEHDVRITPDTIFEAGSVSKQFTAAAVLLLAREHKLSLDDQVRQYIPELPDFSPPPDTDATGSGAASPKPKAAKAASSPLTIRHMLNHTSGLRDWGSVAGIAGWPRTTRVHTHAHMLEIVSRQRATNFTPGTNWSYSNTGFNLAAIIVERVSGMPFPEFTRTRLFQPLGMTHTSWRDDYTRIVRGRAMAYNSRDGEFHTLMPFENVYGNGGLLTTVGDLLKWNENFVKPVVGDSSFVAEQQQRGKFTDGRSHGYGLGLYIGTHKGVPEVYHSGSTAGYQAFLTRFPDQHLSVAVLCNSSGAQAGQYARAVADLYLGDRVKAVPSMPVPSAAQMMAAAGLYRSTTTGLALIIGGGAPLRDRTWSFDGHGGARAVDVYGTVEAYEKVEPVTPTAAQLAELAGTYVSDEAETVLTAVVENGALVLKRRPDTAIKLAPSYKDAFGAGPLGTVIFRRDPRGTVAELSVVQDRVWDLRFARRTK
jgi:CubicO group peptidase (beta-lactamase class C family)